MNIFLSYLGEMSVGQRGSTHTPIKYVHLGEVHPKRKDDALSSRSRRTTYPIRSALCANRDVFCNEIQQLELTGITLFISF